MTAGIQLTLETHNRITSETRIQDAGISSSPPKPAFWILDCVGYDVWPFALGYLEKYVFFSKVEEREGISPETYS